MPAATAGRRAARLLQRRCAHATPPPQPEGGGGGVLRRIRELVGAAPRRTAVELAEPPEPAPVPAARGDSAAAAAAEAAAPARVRPGRHNGALFGAQPQREEIPLHPAEEQQPRTVWLHPEMPVDPTEHFLKQGRELLQDMQDGGYVSLIRETGVPGLWCLQIENLEMGNAITGEMMLQLEETMRMVNRALKTNNEVMALIVRGGGLNFSYGTSPTLHQEKWWQEEGHVLSRYMHALTLELSSLPIITIAAIEGVCAGTALELAAACDFRIVSSAGMLQFADTQLGLIPGWGGAQRVARITSGRAALLMAASGKPCSPQDALELGLADMISRPGETYDDAVTFVRENLHDYSGIGGTHGEVTWRREAIRGMKDNIVASDLFESIEAIQGTEGRNFRKSWDLNAKVMADRRQQAIGLRRAGINHSLEAWNVATDPFATSIPPDEEVGRHGISPVADNTRWGRAKGSTQEAFDSILARPPAEALPSSPESARFMRRQKLIGESERHPGPSRLLDG
eukprot:TRINITY_DN51023_c0_g1_i1.p1 TRINITY_DN51023_c0_g1~~TRINITY_DN51023_c0_g1_i1.p1  ORF type:complete len:540 (+),score=178.28 TRINITY_DN51023_c0_g1_i1:83-1621(+)